MGTTITSGDCPTGILPLRAFNTSGSAVSAISTSTGLRIVDRAEKLVCEKLIETKDSGEVAGRGGDRGNQYTGGKVDGSDNATLTDLGITRDQSADWQRRARMPDPIVDAAKG